MRVLSTVENEYDKRIPKGLYDSEILCLECEKRFGPWDEHAVDVLKEATTYPVVTDGDILFHRGHPMILEIREFDYHKLKMFFVSLLWRAMVSKLPYFANTVAGKSEARLRRIILDDERTVSQEFAVIVSKFSQDMKYVHLNPMRIDIEGVRYQEFTFYNYIFYIKLSGNVSMGVEHLILSEEHPLYLIYQDLRESKSMERLRRIFPRNTTDPKRSK